MQRILQELFEFDEHNIGELRVLLRVGRGL